MRFLPVLLLLSFPGFADIEVDSTRQSVYDYACVDVSGVLPITNHQRLDKALTACTNRALADPDGVYEVQGGRWRIDVDGDPLDAAFDIDLLCVTELEGIQAQTSFDVGLCIESKIPYLVSVDSPDWSVNGTVIVAPVSGQGVVQVSVAFGGYDSAFVMARAWSVLP